MLQIDKKYLVNTKMPFITSDYKVLIEDDEDILFTGKNNFGNRILGSIIEDDEENQILKYFHIIVENKTYLDFIKKNLTYREILNKSCDIFIIEKNYQRLVKNIYLIDISDIPKEYLPLENTYLPEQEELYTLDYIVRLRGKLSEYHKAYVDDLTEIQLGFEKLFQTAFGLLKELKVKPKILQEALAPTSIKLGYELIYEKELFPKDIDLARYLSSFLEYTLLHLPNESITLFQDLNTTTENFENLKYEFIKIYESSGQPILENPNERIKKNLYCGINDLDNISTFIGESCDEIEVYNKKGDDEEPIGIINYAMRDEITLALDKPNVFSDKMEKDNVAKKYRIFIYHLNTETRNGNAIIFKDANRTEFSKPKIRITGQEPLQKSKYTKSLHEQKEIIVSGIATRVGENFRLIEIEYENE